MECPECGNRWWLKDKDPSNWMTTCPVCGNPVSIFLNGIDENEMSKLK